MLSEYQLTLAPQTLDNASEDAARLALILMEAGAADAEPLVTAALAKQPIPELRMDYARVLIGLQRYPEAQLQLETVTRDSPDLLDAWLVLATLQSQESRWADAQVSLQRFIERASSSGNVVARQKGLTQAYLLHSQIA